MGQIFNFHKELLKRRLLERKRKRSVKNGDFLSDLEISSVVYNFPELFSLLIDEDPKAWLVSYEHNYLETRVRSILANLNTNSYHFKIVGIYNLYKNTNPVFTIFNEYNKAMFLLDNKDSRKKWIVSLFKNKEWYALLTNAINKDLALIDSFLRTVDVSNDTILISDCINKLYLTRMRLFDCKKVFESMKKR